jgi:hypothetical protein
MLSCYLKNSYMVLYSHKYLYCFVTMKFHMLVSGMVWLCARLGLDLSLFSLGCKTMNKIPQAAGSQL